MKLVLFCSTQLASFSNFYVAFLCKGYYIEFIMFWRRVGGPGKARKATAWLGMF